MIFRMAVGGNLANQADTIRQIDELTGQIKAYLFFGRKGKRSGDKVACKPVLYGCWLER